MLGSSIASPAARFPRPMILSSHPIAASSLLEP
jgi:hypothetical protein